MSALSGTARRALPLVIGVVLAGCGLTVQQRAAVQTFSAATMDFATVASNELMRSRSDVLAMNRLRVQLDDDVDPARLDEHFTVDRVKARIDAVAALKNYAALLHTLATTSQAERLETAADTFVASLRRVGGVSMDATRTAAVGAAVQQVGGLLVEHRRAQAVRDVVAAAHPTVLAVLDLVRRDFDPDADHWSLGYDKVALALRGAAAVAARRPDAASRAVVIGDARVTAERNRTRFRAVAEQVLGAAGALRQAQVNLRYVLQAREVTVEDIESYVAKVEDVVTVYRILRAE